MMHGDDLGVTVADPVDNAVRAAKELPDSRIADLRNDPPGLWEGLELVDGDDQARDEGSGIAGRIAADVGMNGIEVFAGLGCPVNAAHRP